MISGKIPILPGTFFLLNNTNVFNRLNNLPSIIYILLVPVCILLPNLFSLFCCAL